LIPLPVVLGPTGSGKSDLSLFIARALGGEIVNCDSLQVYRGFDIGTAKVPAAERQGVPHHLIDIVDPTDLFTAGDYARVAEAAIREISARGRTVVLVGGTGFYLRGLLEGLSPGPARDEILRGRLLKKEQMRPGIVHRLDRATSGLMVVAKNDRAHRRLAAQFAAHGRDGRPFERGYLAFVWDAPDRPRGTVDRPIDRHKSVRTRMAIQEGGREAVTHWQLIERFRTSKGTQKAKGKADSAASLLACTLETGRTHQIRVHLASIGHPLLGDGVYGTGFRSKAALLPQAAQVALKDLGRQALHAHMLAFEHPVTGKLMRFRSELPPDLARLHGKLAASRADSSEK